MLTMKDFRRARVWIEEIPPPMDDCQQVLTRIWSLDSRGAFAQRRAAVELSVPASPLPMYGMLGAEVTPYIAGQLKLDLFTSKRLGHPLSAPIANKGSVHLGLPAEYAHAIFLGASHYVADRGAPPFGNVKLNRAAHCVVGSNSIVFKQLTITLLKLLQSSETELTDDFLISLFPDVYS
jgi:hypothetical protein